MKSKVLYYLGLIAALITAAIAYMSCTTVITTQRRPNGAQQSTTITTTQVIDSVSFNANVGK